MLASVRVCVYACVYACQTHLVPPAVAAEHVCVGDAVEECVRGRVVGQA